MDLKRPIKLMVISVLIFYTTLKVYEATNRLSEGKIGTLFKRINHETVEGSRLLFVVENYPLIKCYIIFPQYPSITVCMYDAYWKSKDRILYTKETEGEKFSNEKNNIILRSLRYVYFSRLASDG